MKKVVNKLLGSILIIAFIINPFLQIIIGLGESQADTFLRSEMSPNLSSLNLNSRIERAEQSSPYIQWTLKYSFDFKSDNLSKGDRSKFKNYNYIQGILSNGVAVQIELRNINIQKSQNDDGKYYIEGTGITTYTTDYIPGTGKPNITLGIDIKSNGRDLIRKSGIQAWDISESQRIYSWNIYAKTNQANSSSVVTEAVLKKAKEIEEREKARYTPNYNNNTRNSNTSNSNTSNSSTSNSGTSYSNTQNNNYQPSTYIQPTYEEHEVYQQQPVEVYVPIPENGTNLEDSQKRMFIRNLYKKVLSREPSNDEINGWAQHNPYAIARGVILSQESQDKNNILNISSVDYIVKMYNYLLGRNCSADEAAGHAQWLNKWNNRSDCINIFINSGEFVSANGKATKSITLNSSLCGVVYDKVRGQGYSAIRPNDTTLMMYEADVNSVSNLDLSGKSLTDISGISVFPGLISLNISNNKITNLNEITKLSNLTRLIANDIDLTGKLEPLQKLTKLEVLQLNNCGLVNKDIDENISKVTSLKSLSLNLNKLTNATPLTSLTKLETLYLNNNEIITVGNLGNLNLKILNVKNNISKISTATGELEVDIIKKIYDKNSKFYSQDVELTNCKYENGKLLLNSTEGKVEVKSGNASGYTLYINSTAQKTQFNDKVFLDRLESQLKDTGVIISRGTENGKYYAYIDAEKAKTVEMLTLKAGRSDEKITDITGIGAFPNLKIVNLNNNKVDNLKELAKCRKIQTLEIRNNGLQNLDDIKSLTALVSLDASNNSINQINGLLNLTNLNNLILSNNNIKNSLYPISKLTNLKVLSIDCNGIDNLDYIDGMKIPTLYARYNQIKKTNKLDLKNYENLNLGNNEVEYDIGNDMTTDFPDLIRLAVQEGGVENLQLTDCTIENNKIVIDKAKRSARIRIIDGSFKDSIVKINTRGDTTPPKVTINYDLNSEANEMTVTINADEEIYTTLLGWKKSEDQKTLTKVFNYNAKEVVEIKDLAGNAISKIIEVKGLYNDKVHGLSMSVSNYRMTNQNIIVTYTADEPMYVGEGSNWISSDGGKTLTRVIQGNVSYLFTVQSEENHQKALQLAEDIRNGISDEERDRRAQEIQDGLVKTTFEISNIDKVAPECNVEYSTLEKTSGTVVATIWANEDVELKTKSSDAEVRNGSHIDANGVKRSCVLLYYSENANEDVIIKDTAGNEQTVRVSVNNIDKTVDNVDTVTNGSVATNTSKTMTITADEKIKLAGTSTNSTKASTNSIVMAKAKKKIEAIEPYMIIAGNMNMIPIMSGNINDIASNPIACVSENADLYVRIAEENNGESEDDNTIIMELSEEDQGVAEINDEAENTELVLYDGSFIDTQAPQLSRQEDVKNEDGSVVVTLVATEEIKNISDFAGWTIDDEHRTLRKTFTENTNETLKVIDLAGNETDYELSVVGLNRINYNVVITKIDGTDKAMAIIQADTELQDIEGWELSEDKKALIKVFVYGEKESVLIKDNNGNSSEVFVAIPNFESLEETKEENQQEEQKQEEPKEEAKREENKQDTSPVPFPQTGVYMMISGSMIVILTALTVITLIRYKKNM